MASFNASNDNESDFPPITDRAEDIKDVFQTGVETMETDDHYDSLTDTDHSDEDGSDEEDHMNVIRERLDRLETKFVKASQQVQLLDRKLETQHVRYTRANRDRQIACRYFIRLKAATVEGVRNAFYMYALNIAEEICDIRTVIFGEDLDIEEYIELPEGYYRH